MVKKLLYDISVEFSKNEAAQSNFIKYDHMRKHEGWPVHQGLLVTIANKIAETMLSEKFTKLNKEEKDAQQRAFYYAKEIIDFLLDPLKGAEKHAAIKRYHKKLGATKQRKQPRKE